MKLASVELSAWEIQAVLALVKTRRAEIGRMIQNMEEGEGMDAQRYNLLKTLKPQEEAWDDLVLKLEGAALEAR